MADDYKNLVVCTDGGTRANPGPGACSAWFPQLGEVVGFPLYHVTNVVWPVMFRNRSKLPPFLM